MNESKPGDAIQNDATPKKYGDVAGTDGVPDPEWRPPNWPTTQKQQWEQDEARRAASLRLSIASEQLAALVTLHVGDTDGYEEGLAGQALRLADALIAAAKAGE